MGPEGLRADPPAGLGVGGGQRGPCVPARSGPQLYGQHSLGSSPAQLGCASPAHSFPCLRSVPYSSVTKPGEMSHGAGDRTVPVASSG